MITQVQNASDLRRELDDLWKRAGISGRNISEFDARALLVIILERLTALQIEIDRLVDR